MAAEVNVLPARRADLDAIVALERAGFPEPERWSERSWLGELVADNRKVLIARSYQTLGVITWSVLGELAELLRLVVAPPHRRTGIGTLLVETGVEAVRLAGARAAMLEVGYTNEPAIALYQRLGFEQLRVRDNYYCPGRHALILKRYTL
jgi:[ribosomal protein S18]-alanine N-acetyltransferase